LDLDIANMPPIHIRIAGIGSYVPEMSVPNDEVETRLGLEPGWIARRTGILCRPTSGLGQATSDLAVQAAARALSYATVSPDEIGLLLLATSTPDHLLPPTAPLVAHRLGIRHAGAIDLAGACSGFLYALVLGSTFGQLMQKPVLVIGANVLTRRINPADPITAALFSDGAGAVVLLPTEEPHLLGTHLNADGSSYPAIRIPAGGTREQLTVDAILAGRHLMTIEKGPGLFRTAVEMMTRAGQEALSNAHLSTNEIDYWIPHQANSRIIRETGKKLSITRDRTISVIDRYANSSAATIPIALDHAIASGRVTRGDVLLLTSVGAGMLSAGVVIRW
jgi:3-oxoacyl-[acyl-carrier-protein] synthase III